MTANTGQWPSGGEIDILENVNDMYSYNQASIHVKDDCYVSTDAKQQSGVTEFPNCNAEANESSGCRIAMNNTKSVTWGSDLNNKGGGVVAMQRDFSKNGKGIRMWFWDKTQSLPSDIAQAGKTVNPDNWGTPNANFGKLSCSDKSDGSSQFDAHKVVLDVTMCGDWADGVYDKATQCASKYKTCVNQVDNFGESFQDAFWTIENLHVYQTGSASSSSPLFNPNTLLYVAIVAVSVLLLAV